MKLKLESSYCFKNRDTRILYTNSSLRNFIDQLYKTKINYAVFKSIDTLDLSFMGREDLDIVVDEERIDDVIKLVHKADGIICRLHNSLKTKYRYDILLPDYKECRFYHVDLHTKIPIGLKFNKFNFYKKLSDCEIKFNEKYHVNTVTRSEELRLLLTKFAIRKTFIFGKRLELNSNDAIFDELNSCFKDLGKNSLLVDVNGIDVTINEDGNKYSCNLSEIYNIRANYNFTFKHFNFYKHYLNHAFRKYKYKASRYFAGIFPLFVFDRRAPNNGGKLITFIGVDGSGKSTHIKSLSDRLNWKLSVRKVYLGSGDGDGWWIRKRLTQFLVKKKQGKLGQSISAGRFAHNKLKYDFIYILIGLYSLMLALERYYKVKKALRATRRHITVLSDRWPHKFDGGVLDGPYNVSKKSSNVITRCISKIERCIYEKISEENSKIHHIFLDTSYSDSISRKPEELTLDEYTKRQNVIKSLKAKRDFASGIAVSTAGSLREVEKEIFRVTWQCLK